jgi:hypothetical protein
MIDAVRNGVVVPFENKSGEIYHKRIYPKGIGLMTGPVSGGILAVDFDGASALEKFIELNGGLPPITEGFTSRQNWEGEYPDHFQLTFSVPQEFWGSMKNKITIPTKWDTSGKVIERLELRWSNMQSVLPPSIHPETGGYRDLPSRAFGEIERAPAPMWVIEQMLNNSGETEAPLLNKQPHTQEHWTDIKWALSYLNALSPSRADNYDDWISVGMALHSLNDDTLLLEWDDWSKFSSKYRVGECQKKWKSFNRSGVAIGTLAHMSKQDGWRSPFDKPTGTSFSGGIGSGGGNRRGNGGAGGSSGDGGDGGDGERKILKFPGLDALDMSALASQIREILSQDLPPSGVQAAKIRIRAANPAITERELNQLWSAVELESDFEQTRSDRAAEVDELVKLGDQTLTLADFLPADLSDPVGAWCSWVNIRPETALTALLGGTSSLHKAGTELVISRKRNFTVPPTIYAALVSESGQKKSPILRTLIKQPLDAIENDAQAAFEAALEDWQEQVKAWEQNGGEGTPPSKPGTPPVWYFTDANGEGIKAHASQYPHKTLMGLVDELAGLFNSENKYRNGRGSDRQDMLTYFDTTGAKILRAAGVKARVQRICMSLFGTIQPEVLKRLMKDCSDPDGQWARFLFVNQPLAASDLDDDDYSVDIVGRITDFYRWLDKVPEMEYRLSYDSFKRYQPVYNQLDRLRVSHPQAGMRAVYSKMEGYIGRLAINLHVAHEWAAGKSVPDAEIPLDIMERAIALAKFYIGQVKLVHFNSDDSELAPTLVKLIDLSKRFESVGKDGWVKAKDFINSITRTKRPKPDVARSWMREAEALGFGCTRGNGVHLEYHWNSDNKPPIPTDPPPKKVDTVDEWETKEDNLSTAETTIEQWVEKKVDEVDNNLPSSPDWGVNTQYDEIDSLNTVVETDISPSPSTLSTFSCDDAISSNSAVDNLSPSCLPEMDVSTFCADTQQIEHYATDDSRTNTDVATEVKNLQDSGNTQSPNTRVQFLAERFPHAHFAGFKALTRGESRQTIEAAIAAITSAELKERVMGFWTRIEARFAEV